MYSLGVKLVAYLRVSTDKQADEGLGLEVQERAVRKWARQNRHRIVAVCSDEGVSGSNGLEARVELAVALEMLANGEARGLVVYRLDRLARDLVLQEQLLMEIRRMDAEVFSTSGGEQDYLRDDPDDPSRRLIRQILGAVNEYERGMIRLRLRRGRQRKAEKGGYAGGRPRFGLAATAGVLVKVPKEQQTIEEARRLQAAGYSIRAIARGLAEAGYRTRSGKDVWHPTQVARLLDPAR